MTVIGRRQENRIDYELSTSANSLQRAYTLDLRETNLQNYEFREGSFGHTNFGGTKLEGSSFMQADFSHTNLSATNLEAVKIDALTNFKDAVFELSAVRCTNFSKSVTIVDHQLLAMFGDKTTIIPEGRAKPKWSNINMKTDEFLSKWSTAKAAANL